MSRKRVVAVLATLVVLAPAAWLAYSWAARLPLAEARRAFETGQYAQAAQLAVARLETHPRDQEALRLAARCCAKLGRWEQAEAYFAQAPLENLEDFHLRARGLEVRRLWQEAAPVYEQALQHWRMDGESLQHLAALRGHQGRTEEARTFAHRLERIPSYEVVGHVMTGLFEYQLHNYERVVEAIQEALRRSPDLKEIPTSEPPVVLQSIAESLLALGRAEEAEPYAARAREMSPAAGPCWVLGQARKQLGDEEGAREYWEEAVARDPKYVPPLRDLGQLYLSRRDPQRALEWFKRAEEIEPGDPQTKYGLTSAQRQLAQTAGAPRRPVSPEAAPTPPSTPE